MTATRPATSASGTSAAVITGPTATATTSCTPPGGQGLPSSFFPPYFSGGLYPELTTIAAQDTYLTDALTTLAITTLPAGPEGAEPFFIDLNYYAPHVPIEGPADLVAKYEALLGTGPDVLPQPQYAAMVENIDRQVGRLVDTLAARGLLENTVILFTSDHGALTVQEVPGFDQFTPPTTSGPLRGGKGYLYEGGLTVPLIAFAPGRFAPLVDDFPTTNTDLFATLTHLAGTPESTLDGSPIPSLTGQPTPQRDLYWHFPHYSPQRGRPAGVIISGDHKLIDWFSNVDTNYLFNIAIDRGETTNLLPTQSALAGTLLQQLEEWRQSVGARPMTVNPDYDPEDCD